LKSLFHHKFWAVLCSNDDCCLSQFMNTPNDFFYCTSELEYFQGYKHCRSVSIISITHSKPYSKNCQFHFSSCI